jgi:nicotinamide mononucleotide transporter
MHQSHKNLLITIVSLIISIILGILSHDIVLGGTILFTGLLSAYFASQGRKIQYLLSIINYALMSYAAFHNQLFGSASFYILACLPLQIWGFWQWGKNSDKSGEVKRRKFTFKTSVIVIVSCLVGSLIVGYLLSLIPSQRLSWLDAASNCVNLCGIILMTMRYAESWWIWMVNNTLDLTIWTVIFMGGSSPEAPMMFATSIAYLVINIYGAIKWWRESKIQHKNHPKNPSASSA